MKRKSYIEPQYLYNAKGKATHVYLSAQDYKALVKKFERLSKKSAEYLKNPVKLSDIKLPKR